MEEEFRPGGRPATSRALATVRYTREALARIASGGNPENEQQVPPAQAVWGILYTCEGFVGFFAPRNQTTFAFMAVDTGKASDDINLAVSERAVDCASLSLPPPPRTIFGRLIRRLSGGIETPFRLSWDSGEHFIDFTILRGADSFARELSKRFPAN